MVVTLDRPLLPNAPPPQASGGHVSLAVAIGVGPKDCRGMSAPWKSCMLAVTLAACVMSGEIR